MMSLGWHGKNDNADGRQPLTLSIPNNVLLIVCKIIADTREKKSTVSNVNFPLKAECVREFGTWCFGS